MADIEIIEETPLTMAEMKVKLDALKKVQELSQRAAKTNEHINSFTQTLKKTEEARKKIEALDIARLKPRHIVKILDVQPHDVDSLKAIFTGENLTLKQDDLKKILECL